MWASISIGDSKTRQVRENGVLYTIRVFKSTDGLLLTDLDFDISQTWTRLALFELSGSGHPERFDKNPASLQGFGSS